MTATSLSLHLHYSWEVFFWLNEGAIANEAQIMADAVEHMVYQVGSSVDITVAD